MTGLNLATARQPTPAAQAPPRARSEGAARARRARRVKAVSLNGLGLLVAVVTLLPIFLMISTAFKPSQEIYSLTPHLLPSHPTLSNFRQVSSGQVTVTDGGQSQTVGVDGNGNFTATFTFSLTQEFTTAKPHSVTASYGGATVGTTTFATSSGSANAPDNTFSFLFQLLFLDALFMQLGL